MKNSYIIYFLWLLALTMVSCEQYDDDPVYPASDLIADGKYKGAYWPTDGWRTCHPKEVDMDPKILKEMNEEVRLLLEMQVDFRNLLIVKEGYIVAEQYYSDDYGSDDLHRVFSCTKSLVAACLGIALDKGMLSSLDQKMVDFFPEKDILNMSPGKEDISLEHLLTMSSGMEWYEIDYLYSDERNTYRQWGNAGYGVDFVLNQPMVASPGNEYSYSSGTSHVLSAIVQEATGKRCDSFALEQLFTPLGINDFYWPVDEKGIAIGGSGVRLRPRDMARFGYLYLKNGKWEDEQLLPEDWVLDSQEKHMPRKYIEDQWYGYQFWVNEGYYSAVGFGGQWIMIVPQHDLVVVFNNAFDEGDANQWNTPERLLTNYIIPACE